MRNPDRHEGLLGVRPLVVKVEPYAGENLLSLVSRSCVANVLERSMEFFDSAGLDVRRGRAGFAAFTQCDFAASIAKLLSVPKADVAARMHRAVNLTGYSDAVDWYGTVLPRRYIQANDRRFSPSSLKLAPYHRASWMIRPLTFCTETWEQLLEACPYCAEPLGWTVARGPWRCEHCGRSLRHFVGQQLPHESRANMAAAAAFVDPCASTRAGAMATAPEAFQDWEPGMVFVAMVELGTMAMHWDAPNSSVVHDLARCQFSYFTDRHLLAGHEMIMNWPDSVRKLTKRIVEKNWGGNYDIRKLLGPMGKYVANAAPDTALRQAVVDEMSGVLAALKLPMRASQGRMIIAPSAGGSLSAVEACKTFKIGIRSLERLREGSESFIGRHETKTGKRLYNSERLARAVVSFRASSTFGRAARATGLPPFIFGYLAAAGLVARIVDRDALILADEEGLLESASVQGLHYTFASLARGPSGVGLKLGKALQRQFVPQAWLNVVTMILSKKLHLYAGVEYPPKLLTDYLISQEESLKILALSDGMTAPEDVMVSSYWAAKMMGKDQLFIAEAINQNLIEAVRLGWNYEISLAALSRFDRRYVLMAEATDRLGVDINTARKQLGDWNLSTQKVDERTRLWRRDEFEQALGSIGLPSSDAG